ncbi:hypothetical protein [Clavibacter zhangzhiyongii]|uniref:hypothetical protein n=1 Tax=Clavibacter zhangzhiyongii TaxID=2768071 RepID=UPI0039DF3D96
MRWVDVSEAIDDGRLPADADADTDADAWRWLLLRRREVHDQLGGPWAVLVATVLLGGTVAVRAPSADRPSRGRCPRRSPSRSPGLAVVRRRRVARIDALLQPLLDADATGDPGRRPPT